MPAAPSTAATMWTSSASTPTVLPRMTTLKASPHCHHLGVRWQWRVTWDSCQPYQSNNCLLHVREDRWGGSVHSATILFQSIILEDMCVKRIWRYAGYIFVPMYSGSVHLSETISGAFYCPFMGSILIKRISRFLSKPKTNYSLCAID